MNTRWWLVVAVMGCLGVTLGTSAYAVEKQASYQVTTVPKKFGFDSFYKKHVSANGFPIIGSESVNDYALLEAAYLVNMMLRQRPDVREAMIASGSRLVVMAHDEFTTDIPEHSKMTPKDWWDARARGLGGSQTDPVCSCGEENLLCMPGDPYFKENILIHELAHNIHLRGMVRVDNTFDARVVKAYESAMKAGLWKPKYASVNKNEYFAEGVQCWFNNNRENDHDHNHVNTREELKEYDPALASLCEEVFGRTKLEYTRPATRIRGHLKGFDPDKLPTFHWPSSLDKVRSEIQQDAANRGKNK